ncbi:flagellum-associated coiled-coil domain-containing protein 1 isoform b [Mus musculus]|uniref:Flagellum-associated coiled-coil domain-containing protein 1 n=1 Tax=Mus musculus TaxID=10090 RepID=FACC1_MOUSE|nr:flagellum-associated coiled-coil domain-containing protein 1 isoform b [Mus musculus]Q8BVM7.1 RecName: Full=Flagellum-associated coiled-coil domain-containing protein 1; AltName: Full=Amyotrophic lateral sclerosis 2 chromosomal region candidate gene 12 protein homolog [Mus musculus]BAC36671.1 unnamed protein product [Mus musculus]|eukprot:NP_780579.1 amyotrophic lateral sclerosis 2 chromosomal region candidate gene 12 protein homolog isoform b [Mus musculus]
MDPNPFIYCTCCDCCKLGQPKLIKTPYPLPKHPTGKFKPVLPPPISKEHNSLLSQPGKSTVSPRDKVQSGNTESSKAPSEVIQVSPGYTLIRNREQISVTLGDEMFNRKKHLESDVLSKVKFSRTDIISDLQEQIAELMAIIEQMNRDQQSALKLLSKDLDLRCSNMKQKFETESRELKETHREELERLENNYKEALKAEKALAEEKLDKMSKEYKYLKSMFHVFQDSIYEEMEDKWLRRKAEWEKDEKMEREKILLQQKCRIIKKFELQSEEKKKKMNESISAVSDNFAREKEELLRQHDEDILQIQELRKSKEILEAELRAQATVLETLNTNLFQCQKELERQKTIAANLEKLFQTKLAEAEEKHKYNIKTPTEENNCLRC